MRKRLFMLLAGVLLLSSFDHLDVKATCKPSIQGPPGPHGPRGPRGPQGPIGPTGPALAQALASAYSTTGQLITTSPTAINFDVSRFAENIAFDPTTNKTTFTVELDGVYLITWSLYFDLSSSISQTTLVSLTAFLTSTPPILPLFQSTFQQMISIVPGQDFQLPMTGSVSLNIPANTPIQLEVTAAVSTGGVTFTVYNPMISITRVGDFIP